MKKPYPDFPLTPRRDGRWCKKIRGKVHIFAGNWEEALDEYKRVAEYLHRGEEPPDPTDPDQLRVVDLCNHYLTYKNDLVSSGELSPISFRDYKRVAKRVIEFFGRDTPVGTLKPFRFTRLRAHMATTMGPVALRNEIARIRMMFKFGFEQDLCPAVKFGPTFKAPPKRVMRASRAKKTRTFSPEEIHLLIQHAKPQMKAMILLGINCGCGNSDCGKLEWPNLKGDWLLYPRPKTGVYRKAKLWPETLCAIAEIEKKHDRIVFISSHGNPWCDSETANNLVSKAFIRLLKKLELYRLWETGFYSLRHTFATVAREVGDDEAVKMVMGHVDDSMLSEHYTDRFPDKRLIQVASHVRDWLFPP